MAAERGIGPAAAPARRAGQIERGGGLTACANRSEPVRRRRRRSALGRIRTPRNRKRTAPRLAGNGGPARLPVRSAGGTPWERGRRAGRTLGVLGERTPPPAARILPSSTPATSAKVEPDCASRHGPLARDFPIDIMPRTLPVGEAPAEKHPHQIKCTQYVAMKPPDGSPVTVRCPLPQACRQATVRTRTVTKAADPLGQLVLELATDHVLADGHLGHIALGDPAGRTGCREWFRSGCSWPAPIAAAACRARRRRKTRSRRSVFAPGNRDPFSPPHTGRARGPRTTRASDSNISHTVRTVKIDRPLARV